MIHGVRLYSSAKREITMTTIHPFADELLALDHLHDYAVALHVLFSHDQTEQLNDLEPSHLRALLAPLTSGLAEFRAKLAAKTAKH